MQVSALLSAWGERGLRHAGVWLDIRGGLATSVVGTFETCDERSKRSLVGVDRKYSAGAQNGAFDPEQTLPVLPVFLF